MMTVIAVCFTLLCEGCGAFIRKVLKSDADGFAGPLGMAAIFCLLELLYLPCLVFGASMFYAEVVTIGVLAAALGLTLFFLRYQKEKISAREVIAVLATLGIFLVIQSLLHVTHSSVEMDVIRSNAVGSHVDLGSFRLQGYDLLAAVICRWSGIGQTVVFLSGVYYLLFAEVSLNIIRNFHLKNQWFAFTLVCYALFMGAFNSWQIAESYAGYIWRPMMIALLMYQTYRWLRYKNEWEKYELMFFEGAGMFVSGGFGMITVECLYCLAAWLFYKKKIRSLFDLTTLVAPAVIYGSMQAMVKETWVGFAILGIYIVFLVVRYMKKPRRVLRRAEDYMLEHAVKIMYIIIPVSVLLLNVVLYFVCPEVLVPFSVYKEYFRAEPLKSFFFMDGSYVTYLLDFFRWLGLVLLMITAKNDAQKQLRSMYLLFLILFVNPLSMGVMARLSSPSVYAYSFEVLFNPFTDLCLFIAIYRVFAWQPLGQWILEFALLFSAVFSHVGSFAGRPSGLYTDLVQEAGIVETLNE
jgi:hypothetical protein